MDLNFAFCGTSRREIRGPSSPTYPTPSVCSVTAFGRSVCSVVKTPPLHCPATGRLTRSARRYGDTESGFEVGLRTASPTIRPLRGGTTVGPGAQCTRAALGAWRPNACVLGGSRSRVTDSNSSPPPCPRTSACSVLTGRRPTIPHVREPPRPLCRAGARPLGRGCGRGHGRENSQKHQNCHLTGGGANIVKYARSLQEPGTVGSTSPSPDGRLRVGWIGFQRRSAPFPRRGGAFTCGAESRKQERLYDEKDIRDCDWVVTENSNSERLHLA